MAVFSRPVRTEISFTISDFVMIYAAKQIPIGVICTIDLAKSYPEFVEMVRLESQASALA